MAIQWPVEEWETLSDDQLYEFLRDAPEALRAQHPEAMAAYLKRAVRKVGLEMVIAVLESVRAERRAA